MDIKHSLMILLFCWDVCFVCCSNNTEMEVDAETLTTWVQELFAGVSFIPGLKIPGRVFAFGPRAFPIAIGKTNADGLIVAAELGHGRLIVAAEAVYWQDAFKYDQGCRTTSQGLEYNGTMSVTRGGHTCQRWDSKSPHTHTLDQNENFPDATVADAANYCRNPDGSSEPWCHTTYKYKKRDYCSIPMCLAEDGSDKYLVFRFNSNAKKWLSRGAYSGIENMCTITEVSDMSCLENESAKLALWPKSDELATPESDAKMMEWVKAGGGLFFGIAPWVWSFYTRKDHSWTDIPYYSVLQEAGVGLTVGYSKANDEKYYKDTSPAFISSLYKANIHYEAKTFTQIDDVATLSPYIKSMFEIIKADYRKEYSTALQIAIALPLVHFIHDVENEMTWPFNNETSRPVDPAINNMLSLYTHMSYLGLWQTKKVPYVENFPGDAPGTPTESTIVTVKTTKKNFWSSGYYLLPSDEMTVEVLSLEDESWKSFSVVVGMHTDQLFGRTSLRRFPDISRSFTLRFHMVNISTPFGGMVMMYTPGGVDQLYIRVKFSGVIKAPHYKLDDPQSMQEWKERRLAPAPWADIEGNQITFHLPSKGIRDYDDPGPVMRAWDNAVLFNYEIASKPESEQRHEFFVPDVEIVNGMLHSGYPIMGHIKDFGYPEMTTWPLHIDNFRHQWGLFHELGHNMQLKYWTFDGFIEATCNIFSLINMEYTAKTNPYDLKPKESEGWYMKRINDGPLRDVIRTGSYSIVEENPWTALLSFAQLYDNFGWGCYQEVFAGYEYDIANNSAALPKNNVQEIQQWASRWSHLVGYNLCPMFEFWGYPVEPICDELSLYPPFIPIDNITKLSMGKDRIDEIMSRYPGTHRTLPSKPPCYRPTYFHKLELKAQILEQSHLLKEQIRLMKENVPIFKADKHGMLGKIKDLREKYDKNNQIPTMNRRK